MGWNIEGEGEGLGGGGLERESWVEKKGLRGWESWGLGKMFRGLD